MSDVMDRLVGRPSTMAAVRLIRDTTLQRKAAQRLSGRSGQLGYAVSSQSAWDYDAPIAYSGTTFELGVFRVLYTGDGTQKFPIAVPQFDVRINGTGEGNRMRLDPSTGDYKYEDAAVEVMALEYGEPDVATFESETESAWLIRLFYIGKVGNGNFQLRIKPRAQATCDGTFTVTRVA